MRMGWLFGRGKPRTRTRNSAIKTTTIFSQQVFTSITKEKEQTTTVYKKDKWEDLLKKETRTNNWSKTQENQTNSH